MSTPERAQDRGAHGYGSAGQDIDAVDVPDDAEERERAKEDAEEVREYLRGERDAEGGKGDGDGEPTSR